MNTNMELPCGLLGDKGLGDCVTLNCISSFRPHRTPRRYYVKGSGVLEGIIFLYLHLNNITMQLLWIICS